MIALHEPADTARIADAAIAALLAQRFEDVCQGDAYDPELHAQLFLVEPGDSIAAIEAAGGCRITRGLFDDTRYGEPGFTPNFELLEEHDSSFELVFVENDGGQGVVIFVPKADGVDELLLGFCREYAVPAPDLKAA